MEKTGEALKHALHEAAHICMILRAWVATTSGPSYLHAAASRTRPCHLALSIDATSVYGIVALSPCSHHRVSNIAFI